LRAYIGPGEGFALISSFCVILITCLLEEDLISKISPFKSITVSYERANYSFLA